MSLPDDAPGTLVDSQKVMLLISLAALSLFLVTLWRSYTRLVHVPGPPLAGVSNIPRFLWVWTGRAHEIHITLHAKYGNLVRLGPNMVSVGDPAEISKIYGIGTNFVKVMNPKQLVRSRV